jgi:hypothetical protein
MEPPAAKVPPPERVPETSGPVAKLNVSPLNPEEDADDGVNPDMVEPLRLKTFPLAVICPPTFCHVAEFAQTEVGRMSKRKDRTGENRVNDMKSLRRKDRQGVSGYLAVCGKR